MSDSPHKSPFPAGFERDAKTLLLAFDMKGINLPTLQHNLGRLGIEFVEEPRALPAPQLQRPTLQEEVEARIGVFEDDPDHVFDIYTGAVFEVATGNHVGFLEQEGVVPENIGDLIDGAEAEFEEIGPPPPGAEFIDPEGEGPEGDDVALPRPNPEDDEQLITEEPE